MRHCAGFSCAMPLPPINYDPKHQDTSFSQVLDLIEQGEANRHVGATKMNEASSRSHTIFRMVRSKNVADVPARLIAHS